MDSKGRLAELGSGLEKVFPKPTSWPSQLLNFHLCYPAGQHGWQEEAGIAYQQAQEGFPHLSFQLAQLAVHAVF